MILNWTFIQTSRLKHRLWAQNGKQRQRKAEKGGERVKKITIYVKLFSIAFKLCDIVRAGVLGKGSIKVRPKRYFRRLYRMEIILIIQCSGIQRTHGYKNFSIAFRFALNIDIWLLKVKVSQQNNITDNTDSNKL